MDKHKSVKIFLNIEEQSGSTAQYNELTEEECNNELEKVESYLQMVEQNNDQDFVLFVGRTTRKDYFDCSRELWDALPVEKIREMLIKKKKLEICKKEHDRKNMVKEILKNQRVGVPVPPNFSHLLKN